jgi:hypothetical protein
VERLRRKGDGREMRRGSQFAALAKEIFIPAI